MTNLNPTAQARIEAHKQFKCIECGNCCKELGPIPLNPRDVKRLADYFGKAEKVIIRRHCRVLFNPIRVFIKKDRPCKFYDSIKGCRIYEARPDQCRLHPFLSGEGVNYDGIFSIPINCEPAVRIWERAKENEIVTRDGSVINNPEFQKMVQILTKQRETDKITRENLGGGK